MDALWYLSLAVLLHQATCAGDGTEVTRAVGRSVTFRIQSLDEEATAWCFGSEVIVTVKFGNPPEPIFLDKSYKPRLAFPENGNALTISQLTTDDAGTYTAKTSTKKIIFTLHVYRELVVPTVTCLARNCSAGACSYTLHCTAEGSGSGNVSYSWSVGGWPWAEGPTVPVEELSSGEPLPPVTCTARNPVSSRNATVISPADLCAENTTRSHAAGTYSGSQAAIAAGCVVGVLVLAAVILLIYCESKDFKIFRLPAAEAMNTEAGAEYMTVYAQVGPSQQGHLQNFSNARQDDPKRMPTPGAETSKTIYLTVQAIAQTDDEKMGKGVPGCWEQDEKSVYSSISHLDPAAQPRHGSRAPPSPL